MKHDKKILGITGGIGSGKSTVSRILIKKGLPVIDADEIAKKILLKSEKKAFNELVEYFGNEIVGENGEISKKILAEIVFDKKDKLAVLNAITHKYVIGEIKRLVEFFSAIKEVNVIAIDFPLPVKEVLEMLDEIWVITAKKNIRLERIMNRGGISLEDAYKRMDMQMTDGEYIKLADKVIHNNEDINCLEKHIDELVN
jgi:dephospho-CoA kinase